MSKVDNVQRLLQAEERRNKIVSDAKGRKNAKVKQAKVDAEREVSEFKKELEGDYEKHRATILGSSSANNTDVVRTTDVQIGEMKNLANKRMEKVANRMVDLICAVQL